MNAMPRLTVIPATMFVIFMLLILCSTGANATDLVQYQVEPGGELTYLPSPFGPGIPGCSPSSYQCDFGIAGTFQVHYMRADQAMGTAEFVDVDLSLIGNEDIQDDPPNFGLVTADRVEDFLEARFLREIPVGGPFDLYQDETLPGLELTDFFTSILVSGGYDSTPVDGDGVVFDFNARFIPEPSTAILLVLGVMLTASNRRW